MSDQPERIWASSDWRRIDQGKWWDSNPGGDAEEYVRADRIEALEAKLAKAVEIGNKMAHSIEGSYYLPGVVKEWRTTLAAVSETHKIKGESHE